MLTENEQTLSVISADFVNALLILLSDESDAGHKKIVSIILSAQEKYTAPIKSWVTGWIHQYTRTRGNEIKNSVGYIERNHDIHRRLVEFKELISEGAWNVDSFNYTLFIELMRAVLLDKPLISKSTPTFVTSLDFITQLKDLLVKSIDEYLLKYDAQQKEKKERIAEAQVVHRQPVPEIPDALIDFNLVAAQEMAKTQKDKMVFCLLHDDSWKLLLVTTSGESLPINLSPELRAILNKKNIKDLQQEHDAGILNLIKAECVNSKVLHVAAVRLFIEDMSQVPVSDLKIMPSKKASNSSFVLGYAQKNWTLWWINNWGRANEIVLEQYPTITDWLSKQSTPLNENALTQLKIHLLNVDTQKSVVRKKVAVDKKVTDVLDNMFTQQQSSQSVKKDSVITTPAKKLDMTQYQSLNALFGKRAESKPAVSTNVTQVFTTEALVVQPVESEELPEGQISARATLSLFLDKRRQKMLELEIAEAMAPMNKS